MAVERGCFVLGEEQKSIFLRVLSPTLSIPLPIQVSLYAPHVGYITFVTKKKFEV